MGEFSPIHTLIVLTIMGGFLLCALALPYFLYTVGRKVGEQAGYIRGYKEGQQSLMNAGPARG